ncbi:MAG: DUF4235 domain-containing protein [Candidatus Cyclobacteriaceae bacterium M3_2C_046]
MKFLTKKKSKKLLNQNKPMIYKGVITATSFLTAYLIRKGLSMSWKKMARQDPPKNPASFNTSWKDAILWSIFSGIVLSLAKVAARRFAFSGWYKALGERPDLY